MPVTLYDEKGRVLSKQKTKPRKSEKEKGKEEAPRGFFNRFNNKTVIIRLISDITLEGRLVTNSYNKYDCLLETPEKSEVLIPKHSIAYIGIKNE